MDDYATTLALNVYGAAGIGFGLYAALLPEQARDIFAIFTHSMRDLQLVGWLLFLVGCRSLASTYGTYAMQRKTVQFFMIGLAGMVAVYTMGMQSTELTAENKFKSMIAACSNASLIALGMWACYLYHGGQGTVAIEAQHNLPMSPETGVKTFLRIHHTGNMIWGFAHLLVPEVMKPYTLFGHSQLIGMRILGCLWILWALADIAAIRSEFADQKRALRASLMGIAANTYLLYMLQKELPSSDPRYHLLMPNLVLMTGSIVIGSYLAATTRSPAVVSKTKLT